LSSARKFGNTRDLLGDLLGAKNAGITAAAGDTGRRSSGLKARRLVPHRPDPGVPEVVGPAPPVRRSFGQHKARHPWRSPRTMHSGDLDLREAASPMAGTSICERQLGLSVASLPPSLPPSRLLLHESAAACAALPCSVLALRRRPSAPPRRRPVDESPSTTSERPREATIGEYAYAACATLLDVLLLCASRILSLSCAQTGCRCRKLLESV
jgi:hypothetical protein